MQKKTFCLVLTLTVVYFAESSPINVDTHEFDNLDVEYPDLGYERDEQTWGAFLSNIIDEMTKKPSKDATASKDSKKTNVRKSGLKKKKEATKGVHSTHSSGDLNTFFKKADVHDHGNYDAAEEAARAEAIDAQAAITKRKETRSYAKGNNTTGFHRVQHKEEYNKDQEFYENDETKGTINREGAKVSGTRVSAGAGFNKSNFKHDRQKGIHGNQGHLDNGFFDKQFSEFEDSEDIDEISDEVVN